jgi:hypothetical protein
LECSPPRRRSRQGPHIHALPADCFAAFRNNNRVGCLIWVGLLVSFAIR